MMVIDLHDANAMGAIAPSGACTPGFGDRVRSRGLARRLGLVVLAVVLGLLFVWPLVMLGGGAFRTAAPGHPGSWTLGAFSEALSSPGMLRAIGNSVILAISGTAAATLIAAGLAWLSERTDAPLRRWIAPAMVVMFATPSLFYAIGYGQLANPYTGFLNHLLALAFGPEAPRLNVENWPGLILVTVLRKVSVFYLFLVGPFRALEGAFEEASLMAGYNRVQTFFRITLPSLAPALAGVILLGLASGLHAFDIPLILGQPAKIEVVSLRIFAFLTDASPPAYGPASALSLLLVGAVLLIHAVQVRLQGRKGFVSVAGKGARVSRTPLRRGRPLAGVLIGGYLLLSAGLPLLALIYASVQPYPGDYSHLTLSHYVDVLAREETAQGFGATALLATVTGGAAMLIALAVVEASRRLGRGAAAALRLALLIPLALPGLVTALAVVWAYVAVPGLRELYGTIWMMALALVVVIMPLAMQQASAATGQVGDDLREAARVSGAGPARAFVDVVARLVAPSFIAGWYVGAVMVAGNVDVPLLLGAPGLTTLSAQIYDLNALGRGSEASALLVVMMLALAGVGVLGGLLLRAPTVARSIRTRLQRPVPEFA